MKKNGTFLRFSVLMACFSVSEIGMAQPVVKPTPASGKYSNLKISRVVTKIHLVNQQVRSQTKQIEIDLKAGKISQAEAKVALTALRDIRLKEKKFIVQNQNGDITENQAAQLNQEITQNEKNI